MPKTIKKIEHLPKLQRKKRVAAYARVSSGKDAMIHSLSAQVSYYNELIQKEYDWEFVGVYSDEAITGTKEMRQGFQQMLTDCKNGKIDMIITKSISRFARNTVTLLKTVRMLKSMNIDVFFEEQNIHTMSADGELMLTILASYAQEESRSASENQKWRIKKNFEEGIPWCGKMLGYRIKNGQYCIIPKEAELVRRIYNEYLEGAGVNLICKRLTDDNIPPINGEIWHPRSIAKILRNYTYTGNLLLQKTFTENHITKKSIVNVGQRPKYLLEEAHEAIINIETFNAVQAEIERRADLFAPSHQQKLKYQYTGKILCAKCGKNYRRKTTRTQNVWICATYNSRGKQFCASKQIPESVLDELSAEFVDSHRDIEKIVADDNNTLHFHFDDGSFETRIWQDCSRRKSWTTEKREKARQKAYERNKNNGKSSNDNTGNQG